MKSKIPNFLSVKKEMTNSKFIFMLWTLACVSILIFAACSPTRPKIKAFNPGFGKYITGYTSGMISRKSGIRIELSHSPNEDNLSKMNMTADTSRMHAAEVVTISTQLPDSNLLKHAFEFEPALKGKAVWISDRLIEFIPSEVMPVNQFYTVNFKLNEVAKVEDEFENFSFQVSTYQQNLFVTVDGLRTYDDYNSEWQKLSGKITCSDFEDSLSIKKAVTVTQNGKLMPVKITSAYNSNEFYFYIDSIERKEHAGKLTVSWNGEVINAASKGTQELNIPALGDFSISQAKIIDQEDQYVELTFSDPIDPSQNLKGIVTIHGIDNLTYAVENNVVKVFLANRIIGEKLVTVTTGIKNFKGYKMNSAYTENFTFEEPKPLVRIKGHGSILPNSNGLIFLFEAVSLKAVDVRVVKIFENNVHQFLQGNNLDGEDNLTRVGKIVAEKTINLDYNKKLNLKQWNSHVIDLAQLISPDPGAIYRVSIRYTKKYALCDCEFSSEETTTNDDQEISHFSKEEEWNENNWNYYGFDGYDNWSYYNEDYSPCDNYYYRGKAVSRNILASDIGLIYKLDDSKFSHAFVSNMITAKPLPNTTIEYYDYTKQLIAQGVTDANGMLDLQLKSKPFLMLAKNGKQRAYLKLQDGYANSLSKFDVEGEVVQKGVKGFLYGERGVWRPGDSLYINFMIEDKEKRLPPNHPVKFELQDPNGTVVYQTTKTKNLNGLYDFRTSTGAEAITGNYKGVARVGNRIFSENFKIETVKPNRLKIYLDFDKGKINDSTAKLSVKWLHGAVAKNLHALVNVSVNQNKTSFEKFKAYEFDSPIRSYYSESEAVFDANLNEKGEAYLNTYLHVGQTAPGMLRATYVSKVFEAGGDFSIDRYSVAYSPYKTYIGLFAPETKNFDTPLETGSNYHFDVVSVNEKGSLVNTEKLQVKIYKVQWRWWYEKDEEDLAHYISRSGTIILKDTFIKTNEGRGGFNFKVNYPEYGRYLITVTDLKGGHQTGKVVTVDWPYWSRTNRSNNENANMLNFACDKKKYISGETIKLSFPSPADGMALVSIETGKVVKKFWIPTKKGETIHEFSATSEMAPNAYVHVTLIQPHTNTKNDLPIRMYGVVTVLVDEPLTHLIPEIQMADVIKPESFTRIKVKEKKGRKMAYTLAMVDEGLLDLTRFKTPQPWNTFYAREALGVKTWDLYDAVIGAYAGKLDKLLSVGGDGDGSAGKGVKANRFKPMVKFMGPFVIEANQEKTHTIEIPNYLGSVRVMVIAENEGAYGNTEKTVAVRKPLMILATLPRVLGPGESVSLPVDIFAMENHVKDVKVEVEVNEFLELEGPKTQTTHFTQVGDEVINFKLNVVPKLGIAKVKITATSGKEKAVQEMELDVRPSNPKVSDGSETALEPGKEWNTEINFKGIAGSNKATIEFSSIPSLGLEKRLSYLIQYPHGCIEQTTSSVFPQLFVMNLINMKESEKLKVSSNIKAGLKRLQLFQTSNGGFSYWPGESYDSEWGSNYAGHFMIEAEKQGYSLPVNLKTRWIKYQQQQARNWSANSSTYSHPHGNETNEVIQAYRLFVLALSNNAQMGAMNRLREEKNLSATAKWRLAAAYKLVGQTEVALKLIEGLSTSVQPYKELSYSYGSDTRDEAMILETLSLLDQKQKAWPLAKEMAKELSSVHWLSTQETAYGLLAMCAYVGVKENNGEMNFSYSVVTDEKTIPNNYYGKKTIYQVKYSDKDFAQTAGVIIKNNGKSVLFAKVIVEGIPLTGDKSASATDLAMTVKYKDMKGKEIQPDKLIQGTEFLAEVSISNPGTKRFLKEMALNQIFPSGWEIHNSRMDGTGETNAARYQDIRDDRVYSYYDLAENTSKTFIIHLNATYLGKFYLPTVYSEAMYDNSINARVPGPWVEVLKENATIAGK